MLHTEIQSGSAAGPGKSYGPASSPPSRDRAASSVALGGYPGSVDRGSRRSGASARDGHGRRHRRPRLSRGSSSESGVHSEGGGRDVDVGGGRDDDGKRVGVQLTGVEYYPPRRFKGDEHGDSDAGDGSDHRAMIPDENSMSDREAASRSRSRHVLGRDPGWKPPVNRGGKHLHHVLGGTGVGAGVGGLAIKVGGGRAAGDRGSFQASVTETTVSMVSDDSLPTYAF